MKNMIKNCLATTGMALIFLSVIALFYGGSFLCIETVFQTGAASLLIHIGLLFAERFESNFILLEIAIEIGYILGVLIVFGFVFDWYASLPPGMLIVLGILVYIASCLFGMYRMKSDVNIINNSLCLRNRK